MNFYDFFDYLNIVALERVFHKECAAEMKKDTKEASCLKKQ
jgi:hypothetical protein